MDARNDILDGPRLHRTELALSLRGPTGRIKGLDEINAEVVAMILQAFDGNVAEASRRLGISRGKLYRLKGMGVQKDGGHP